MAMSILNNTMSMMGLGELNKNITKVGKDLVKVSSGQRIASAADGPSEYAISEKMRTRIRGLNQCDINTQTGRNMIEVASGGVKEQLEALKKLREIALKSSDDTYTDFDRDILQKEAGQLLKEVDDIAYETNYNGKLLLNGITEVKETVIIPGLPGGEYFDPNKPAQNNTETIVADNTNGQYPNSTPVKIGSNWVLSRLPADAKVYAPHFYGYLNYKVYDPNNIVSPAMSDSDIKALNLNRTVYDSAGKAYTTKYLPYNNNYDYVLAASDGTTDFIILDSTGQGIDFGTKNPVSPTDFPAGVATLSPHQQQQYDENTNPQPGDVVTTSPTIGSPTFTIDTEPFSGKSIIEGYSSTTSSYKLDFPALQGASFPSVLDNQGISFLCSGCEQFVSIKFDTSNPIGTATEYPMADPSNTRTKAYSIGVSDVTSPTDLARAIFEGIKSLNGPYNGSDDQTLVTPDHGIHLIKDGDNYYIKKEESGLELDVYNGFKGALIEKPTDEIREERSIKKPYQDFRIQGETKASMYTNLRFPNTTLKVLFPPEDSDFDLDPAEEDYPNPWPNEYQYMSDIDKEYYNEKYNCEGDEEKIRREKWRDEFWPYPRKGAVATESAVRTKENAKKFIADIDNAIKYILDTSTSFGSQSMRMTIMNDNIVTNNENTQGAESVIRDADMAKEMVQYTKDSILSQSSQAMLSQANQNVSSVLSLLQ